MPNREIATLTQYYDLLKVHDWKYRKCRDQSYYKKQVTYEKFLRSIKSKVKGGQELFCAFKDFYKDNMGDHPYDTFKLFQK